MSKALTVVVPQSSVVQETTLTTIMFEAVFGLNEAGDVRFLRMLIGQNEQVICTIPDARPTVVGFASTSSVNETHATYGVVRQCRRSHATHQNKNRCG